MGAESSRTEAYERWVMAKVEISGLLALGTDWMDEALQKLWDEIGREPSDGETEWEDEFHDRTHGAGWEFPNWVIASALKDAVTAFEVFLEQLREELLNWIGYTATHRTDTRTPSFPELREFFGTLGYEVEVPDVKKIRDRRHLLTHKRGEMRTEGDLALCHDARPDQEPRYGPTIGEPLRLTAWGVRQDLAALDQVASGLDVAMSVHIEHPGEVDDDAEFGLHWVAYKLDRRIWEKAGYLPIDD